MKRLYSYRLPFLNGKFREGLILQIDQCFGDIAPLPGYSSETLLEAQEEAVRLLPAMPHAMPTLPSVRFALACAQQSLSAPISLPLNALQTHRTGFQALKLKLGDFSLNDAIELIKQIPKHIELRLDFNRRWPLDRLLALASHFSPTDFAYFEEPTAHFSDLLAFSRITEFPIAIDESMNSIPYWEIPTLKTVVVKPTIIGYIPAPPPNTELIFSSAYESGIGALHLARLAQYHNPNRPHGLDPYTHLAEDLLARRPTIEEGLFCWSGGEVILDHPSLCLIASSP